MNKFVEVTDTMGKTHVLNLSHVIDFEKRKVDTREAVLFNSCAKSGIKVDDIIYRVWTIVSELDFFIDAEKFRKIKELMNCY